MTRQGADYVSLSPAQAHGLGVAFVMRYLSDVPSKNLSHAEALELAGLGIDVGVVWEDAADAALGGRLLGETHAHKALAQAIACGMTGAWPIMFAVDFDTAGHPERTDAYFDGVASVLGHGRCGPYGGYEVVKHQADRGFEGLWQTYAWSRGRWDSRAQIQQYDNSPGSYDRDREVRAGSVWRPGQHKTEPSPLDVLLPVERNLAERYLGLVDHHATLHPHAIAKLKGELVAQRKAVWLAAEKGLTPAGKHTAPGWGVLNRAARYRELQNLTK